MGNERSTLRRGNPKAEDAIFPGRAPKGSIFDRLRNGGPSQSQKRHRAKLRPPKLFPFWNRKFTSDSVASSLCNSVAVLRVTPISEGSFRTRDCLTKEHHDSSYDSSSASATSACSSNRSMASFKRCERGRSPFRWSNFRLNDNEDSGNESSAAELCVLSVRNCSKTPWPITVKDSLFYPQFPRRTRSGDEPRFEKWLSRGRFSSVSKVVFGVDGQRYALKQISKSFLKHNTDMVRQVKEEVEIQKEYCRHPFLLSAVDSWQTRTLVCILTPFVEGGDLEELARRHGFFPLQVVQIWAAEIGMALDHLHKCGVLHRDLKLGNILIDTDGHLKLTDFGLAKLVVDDKRARTICGTLEYMAPEVMAGGGYDIAADWWSYGILIYRLLMGRYPLEAQQDHVLMREEVTRHCYIGWDVCEGLQSCPSAISLLGQLLKKDRDRRLKDFSVIKKERFFKEVDFADVLARKVQPFCLFETRQKVREWAF